MYFTESSLFYGVRKYLSLHGHCANMFVYYVFQGVIAVLWGQKVSVSPWPLCKHVCILRISGSHHCFMLSESVCLSLPLWKHVCILRISRSHRCFMELESLSLSAIVETCLYLMQSLLLFYGVRRGVVDFREKGGQVFTNEITPCQACLHSYGY